MNHIANHKLKAYNRCTKNKEEESKHNTKESYQITREESKKKGSENYKNKQKTTK